MNQPRMRDADMPLLDRIDAAIKRVTSGQGQMRVPVEATDPDMVLLDCKREIEQLRAAIEAAESAQPVAFITRESMMRLSNGGNDSRGTVPVHRFASAIANRPLYLHPPEPTRQPLTDDEIKGLAGTPAAIPGTFIHAIVRAVERHHRIESESK